MATRTALPTMTPVVQATPTTLPTVTPTPSNTLTPAVVAQVQIDGTTLREGPALAYPQLGRLNPGAAVTVTGRNRDGDWWRVCCTGSVEAWIPDAVVTVTGPLWIVEEVANIAPPPTRTPTVAPTASPAPTPTPVWPFRLEYGPFRYPAGGDYFMVAAAIYNGTTPLWGYKLRIRKLSTGEEWLTEGSEAYWKIEPTAWGEDLTKPSGMKRNVKWDSNATSSRLDDGEWEITCTDGGGSPVSAPVRIRTSKSNPLWYYLVFTNRK